MRTSMVGVSMDLVVVMLQHTIEVKHKRCVIIFSIKTCTTLPEVPKNKRLLLVK